MTSEQAERYHALLHRLKDALPIIERLGFEKPPVLQQCELSGEDSERPKAAHAGLQKALVDLGCMEPWRRLSRQVGALSIPRCRISRDVRHRAPPG